MKRVPVAEPLKVLEKQLITPSSALANTVEKAGVPLSVIVRLSARTMPKPDACQWIAPPPLMV